MPMTLSFPTRGIVALAASILAVAACSSAEEDAARESASGATRSPEPRFLLVPVDSRARTGCRDETGTVYGTENEARTAAERCATRVARGKAQDPCTRSAEACLRVERRTDLEGPVNTAPLYPTPSSCGTPVPRSCGFYAACIESAQSCGEDGYALGYGERYCAAFKNLNLSSAGETWRDSVMVCLQRELFDVISAKPKPGCTQIAEAAYATHAPCYTQEEASICSLGLDDITKILSTIGAQELLRPRTLRQELAVAKTCATEIARRLDRAGRGSSAGRVNVASLRGRPNAPAPVAAPPSEWPALESFWKERSTRLEESAKSLESSADAEKE